MSGSKQQGVSNYHGYKLPQSGFRISGNVHMDMVSQPQSTFHQGMRGSGVHQSFQNSCWFTRIPLGKRINPEQVKVTLSPENKNILIIKLQKTSSFGQGYSTPQMGKNIFYCNLPQGISKKLLQVKLTPQGELLVFAPYKSMMGKSNQFNQGTQLSFDFVQNQLGGHKVEKCEWQLSTPIPIRGGLGRKSSRYPFSSSDSTDSEEEISEYQKPISSRRQGYLW